MSSYNREAERDVDDAGAPGEGLPDQIADLANAQAPSSLRGIRACKVCGILKTLDQFLNEGCENCPFLDIADNPERANTCTSAFYEGQAAVMEPRESWAAKWLRIDHCLPGVYAISITGQLDREVEEDCENRGTQWRCKPAGADTD